MTVHSFFDWAEWAEPIAYGPLALRPREFEELQPHEFYLLLEGYRWRQEQEENKTAYFTAASMSVHTKRPVSPKDLIKPLRQTKKPRNKAEDEQYLREVFGLN